MSRPPSPPLPSPRELPLLEDHGGSSGCRHGNRSRMRREQRETETGIFQNLRVPTVSPPGTHGVLEKRLWREEMRVSPGISHPEGASEAEDSGIS